MRVALYLRVSTRGAKNGKEQSVENQRAKLRQIAEANDWNVVAEYEDRESGSKDESKRPQFRAMLEAAKGREFDAVAVWALDRFSRQGIAKTFEYGKAHTRRVHGSLPCSRRSGRGEQNCPAPSDDPAG